MRRSVMRLVASDDVTGGQYQLGLWRWTLRTVVGGLFRRRFGALGERTRNRLRTGGKRSRPWAVAIQRSLS